MSLGSNLKKARETLQYTQEEVANIIQTSKINLWRWEHDKVRPNWNNLDRLAKLYGLTLGELLDD